MVVLCFDWNAVHCTVGDTVDEVMVSQICKKPINNASLSDEESDHVHDNEAARKNHSVGPNLDAG